MSILTLFTYVIFEGNRLISTFKIGKYFNTRSKQIADAKFSFQFQVSKVILTKLKALLI